MVRVAAHERDGAAVRVGEHGVPAQQHALAVRACPVRDGAAREVAAGLGEGDAGQDLDPARPGPDRRVRAGDPLPVRLRHQHRDPAELPAPLDLDAEHVRVAGHDGGDVTELADPPHAVGVEVPDRVPEQVPRRRAHELGRLPDPGLLGRRDPEQVGLELGHLHPAAVRRQLLERGPALPVGGHPLPLIGADGADLDAFGVLDGAGRTDPETGHEAILPMPLTRVARAIGPTTAAVTTRRRSPT